MSSTQPDHQLAPALADLQRLINVYNDLATSKHDCAGVKALIDDKAKGIGSSLQTCDVDLSDFEKLADIASAGLGCGRDFSVFKALSSLAGEMILAKIGTHPAMIGSQDRKQSQLQQLGDLDLWILMRKLVGSFFWNGGRALEDLDKVIAYDLRHLGSCTVDHEDAISLLIIELAAKVRKTLPYPEFVDLDKIISTRTNALKGSGSITTTKRKPVDEPTVINNATHGTTSDLQNQVGILQEKVEELQDRIEALQHDNCGLSQEKLDLQASAEKVSQDFEEKIARLADDFHDEQASHESIVKTLQEDKTKLEDENASLKRKLRDEDKSYAKIVEQIGSKCEYCDGSDYQKEVMRIIERLQETEEDRSIVMTKFNNLTAEKSDLQEELEVLKIVLQQAEEAQSSLAGSIQCLEGELKYSHDTLEDAQDEIIALRRNMDKLKIENARRAGKILETNKLLQEMSLKSLRSEPQEKLIQENTNLKNHLADVRLAYAMISSTVTAQNMHMLTAQNLQLEKELEETKAQLHDHISAKNYGITPTVQRPCSRPLSTRGDQIDGTKDYVWVAGE